MHNYAFTTVLYHEPWLPLENNGRHKRQHGNVWKTVEKFTVQQHQQHAAVSKHDRRPDQQLNEVGH